MFEEGDPLINHVLHKTSPCIYIPNHSTIMGGIYAKVTLGMYPLIESERSRISLLLHAMFEEGDPVINQVLH